MKSPITTPSHHHNSNLIPITNPVRIPTVVAAALARASRATDAGLFTSRVSIASLTRAAAAPPASASASPYAA